MVKIRPDENSSVIRQQIEQYTQEAQVVNVGTVLSVGDGIARIYGLEKAMAGELLEFQDGTIGVALNLESDNVGAVLMGDGLAVQEGDSVKATGKIAQVPVGEGFLGRVVDGLARPIDGKGDIKADGTRLIESPAPGIIARRSVYEPLQTGLVSIDAMIPIGRGQRELIIGDRQTGKTAVATDTIINQKGGDCICVYVAIGQKASTVAQIVTTLTEADAMSYTNDVAENAGKPDSEEVGPAGSGADATSAAPNRSSQTSTRQNQPKILNRPAPPSKRGSKVPENIPDARDDDIIARQLREAAMQEEDEELREKLWEEYRRYKKG